MKRILFLILATLFIFYSSGYTQTQLKVMTWNIWHGGSHGNEESQYQKDKSNTVNIIKVIKQNDPGILLMQETYDYGMEIGDKAGFLYSWRGSSNLSIHSKYEISDNLTLFKPFNSHGVVIEVEGRKVIFINVWLHYLPDYFNDIKTLSPKMLIQNESGTRLKEIIAILTNINSLSIKYPGVLIIMGGDFNSGSHLDWIKSTKEWHYHKVVEWPVSKTIVTQGFTDSYREVFPNPNPTLEGTWGFLSEDIISDRIDFIYYKGRSIKTIFSKIIKDDPPGGFFNSDHRAVLSVFELNQ